MAIGFRHADPRFPFLWESDRQPPARWHGTGQGPVQYLCDTPDGAWAEFLRHEGITDPADLAGISRRLWAIEVDLDAEVLHDIELEPLIARGGTSSYPRCQDAALAARQRGATALRAPSAALRHGGARGQLTDGGLREAEDRDGSVWVLIGPRPGSRAWGTADAGSPPARVLALVEHLSPDEG